MKILKKQSHYVTSKSRALRKNLAFLIVLLIYSNMIYASGGGLEYLYGLGSYILYLVIFYIYPRSEKAPLGTIIKVLLGFGSTLYLLKFPFLKGLKFSGYLYFIPLSFFFCIEPYLYIKKEYRFKNFKVRFAFAIIVILWNVIVFINPSYVHSPFLCLYIYLFLIIPLFMHLGFYSIGSLVFFVLKFFKEKLSCKLR